MADYLKCIEDMLIIRMEREYLLSNDKVLQRASKE